MKSFQILLLLIVCLATGCRTIHRLTRSADSTVSRSASSGEQWQREIIREYLPGPIRYDTIVRYDTLHVQQVVRVPAPYPVREIIRESGARQQAQHEDKQRQTQTSEKEAQTPLVIQGLMLLCGLSVFGAIGMAALHLLRK